MADLRSIQRVPIGLLELLGMKGSGTNPNAITSEVRPVVDLAQMYGIRTIDQASAINAALAIGGTMTITVPQNEHWLLFNAFTFFTGGGGTITELGGNVALDLGSGQSFVVAQNRDSSAAGFPAASSMQIPWQAPYPWIIKPGGAIIGQCTLLTGAAACVGSITASFARLAL